MRVKKHPRAHKADSSVQIGRTLPNSGSQPGYPQRPSEMLAGKPKGKRRILRFITSILLILFIFILVIGVWDARNISSASQKLFGTSNIFSLLNSSGLKETDNGRVNVLVVGYSIDDPGHPAATLTDSILLLSMSTKSHTGYMLSVPRDLYVKIPGFGYGKINEAYQDGGIELLERIVSDNFQLPIGYYALVNYAAVRGTVDALGGIKVNIQSPDPRGLYDPNISPVDGGPLQLANGLVELNGQQALNLTRARGDAYGAYGFPQADFDRTAHQRLVFTAIKQKVSWKLILNPTKNNKILNAVAANVKTDIKAGEARPLFDLFNSIPANSLQSLSLRELNGKNYLSSYITAYGQSALVPSAGISDYDQIRQALEEFNN